MDIKNLRFSSEDETRIDMDINHDLWGWIPFTATEDDVELLGRELFEQAMIHKELILPYDKKVYEYEQEVFNNIEEIPVVEITH